jgi:hypothetical protein
LRKEILLTVGLLVAQRASFLHRDNSLTKKKFPTDGKCHCAMTICQQLARRGKGLCAQIFLCTCGNFHLDMKFFLPSGKSQAAGGPIVKSIQHSVTQGDA